MVDTVSAKIIDVSFFELRLKNVDSKAVPTTAQHTTTSAIDPGRVCENTFNMTIAFKDAGF
ncbi:MAG: hypothetical protein WCF03_17915 [Nitrososphaeraceae archaeon]